jgi:hypothetical protein
MQTFHISIIIILFGFLVGFTFVYLKQIESVTCQVPQCVHPNYCNFFQLWQTQFTKLQDIIVFW